VVADTSPTSAAAGAAPVRYTHDGQVAIITIDNPPVNALSLPVRAGISDALGIAIDDANIRAILIVGSGKIFCGGADIREFDRSAAAPSLTDVINAIERSPKPVVAAIHGAALGGGLELAMACHGRLGATGTKLGLPEVTLGLIPGAGGTQRLPRLIPLRHALPMIVKGQSIDATLAAEWGLIDQEVGQDTLVEMARHFALTLAEGKWDAVRDLPVNADGDALAAIDAFEREISARIKGQEAPAAAIEALRNAVRFPFDEATANERAMSLKLRTRPQSMALRHLHFAERQVFKVPGLDKAVPRTIEQVGIVGAGTMGTGIALAMLSAGLSVTLVEQQAEVIGRARGTIESTLARDVTKGRMTDAQRDAALQRLAFSGCFDPLCEADLIVEAAYETIEIKKSIFATLDQVARRGAILASNTSYLDIDMIAAAAQRPENVVGLHFFSPANIMKLLEIVRGARTAPDVIASSLSLAKKIGKVPVVAGNCHGFIGNRMLAVRRTQAEAMLAEGASAQAIDAVIESFGFPMGPFRMADLAGLDLGWNAAKSGGATIRERLNEAGRHGQKAGAGFYDYDDVRNAVPSPAVDAIVRRFAQDFGVAQRRINSDEMHNRLFLPMIDEGIRILAEGIAMRPGDIDVVWVNGYGWPRHTGGPMHYAEVIGLTAVADGLAAIGMEPSPALQSLAASGASLNTLAQTIG
jgi:3-hydroxyacyl-CoA dehydrogenase